MRFLRLLAILATVLLLVGLTVRAEAEGKTAVCAPARTRGWWGMWYDRAPALVRAEGEARDAETEQVEFIWPLWQWLLYWLGL